MSPLLWLPLLRATGAIGIYWVDLTPGEDASIRRLNQTNRGCQIPRNILSDLGVLTHSRGILQTAM